MMQVFFLLFYIPHAIRLWLDDSRVFQLNFQPLLFTLITACYVGFVII